MVAAAKAAERDVVTVVGKVFCCGGWVDAHPADRVDNLGGERKAEGLAVKRSALPCEQNT